MREKDIRPAVLFNEYLRLSRKDAEIIFKGQKKKELNCIACDAEDTRTAFFKWGFEYKLCRKCNTLYQSPRPSKESFDRFYRESESAEYWANTFWPAVESNRKTHLIAPKVTRIGKLFGDSGFAPRQVADIGAGSGTFLAEFTRKNPDIVGVAVEPQPDMAARCRDNGFTVYETFVEELPGTDMETDCVLCFEVLEHVWNPMEFVRSLVGTIKKGGGMLFTTLTASGFDIQLLWEHSKSVSPPHHINFLSIDGLRILFERSGLRDIQITTPGELDVDIVRNRLKEDPTVSIQDRFVSGILQKNEGFCNRLQTFLKENQLSSHCWIWARR